jgi:hypothetical protein
MGSIRKRIMPVEEKRMWLWIYKFVIFSYFITVSF